MADSMWATVCISLFALYLLCVRVSADPLSSECTVYCGCFCALLMCCIVSDKRAASSLNVCAAACRTMHKFGRFTANPQLTLCAILCLSFLLSIYAHHSIVFYCRFCHGNCFLCEHRWYGPWLCECYLSHLTPATIHWPLSTFPSLLFLFCLP